MHVGVLIKKEVRESGPLKGIRVISFSKRLNYVAEVNKLLQRKLSYVYFFQKFGGIEKYAIYPMMTVIKQEVMDEPALAADSMQKVPSLSDLSDPDSSLGK